MTSKAEHALLKAKEIKLALQRLPSWSQHGKRIRRTYGFEDFPAAIKFVNKVATRAEKLQHHPDIDIRWNQVALTLSTYSAGGLTQKDFAGAEKFDQCYQSPASASSSATDRDPGSTGAQ